MRRDKRIFDLTAATAGLIALAPVFAIVAVLVKLDDGGPVFFRQVRVGRMGVPFRIWKFRTMVRDAEERGRQITIGSRDPRVTRIGRWLRRCKIDELPQLFNVMAGEMSLVGPRPEVPHYVAKYTHEQRRVLEMLPGITDPASIRFRAEGELLGASVDPEDTYLVTIVPEKIRMNLEYANKATFWTDLWIIGRTVFALPPVEGPSIQRIT